MRRYDELLRRDDAPPGSSWGLFGGDDELGTVNLLTPERVLRGVGCVRRGQVFNLDLALDAFTPSIWGHRSPPVHRIIQLYDNHRDDYLETLYLQGTTQVDGLRHYRDADHGFYNGVPDYDIRSGSPRLGINRVSEHGIVGRGVLLDVEAYLAAAGTPIDHEHWGAISAEVLEETARDQGVALEAGDILLIRTGFARHVLGLPESRRAALAEAMVSVGLEQSQAMVGWLWDHQAAVVAADNFAVEAFPPAADSPFLTRDERAGGQSSRLTGAMHRALIPLLGVTLGELWWLEDLAADCASDGVYEALVVAKPLNLTGGVGSPANAVAVK